MYFGSEVIRGGAIARILHCVTGLCVECSLWSGIMENRKLICMTSALSGTSDVSPRPDGEGRCHEVFILCFNLKIKQTQDKYFKGLSIVSGIESQCLTSIPS